jgi:hypothetical protein
MYTYLVKTEDTTVIKNKEYYTDVVRLSENSDNYQCTAKLVTEPATNPKDANYYEAVEGNHS